MSSTIVESLLAPFIKHSRAHVDIVVFVINDNHLSFVSLQNLAMRNIAMSSNAKFTLLSVENGASLHPRG